MRLIGGFLITAGVLFVLAQFLRPAIPAKPATAEVQASPAVKQILQKSCYSCHSDERRLSWFDQIVPAYWLVRHDILTARSHINFSTLGSSPAAVQRATLFEAVNMIQLGAMPLPQFLALHPDAKVTPEELADLKAYLAPWATPPPLAGDAMQSDAPPVVAVQPERNGLAFDPTFESWAPISFTDRGDNNTFRFILGNDVAVKAAQAGNISPWPDGTRFAKIAWQQELDADGMIRPGKFIQVELMVKDAGLYKGTEGWGWGRWRGLDLKPYGNNAQFVRECTTCHLPMHGNDYVYTLPITSARVNRNEIVNNSAASLPAGLPWQPLGWRALTMYVDPRTHTMASLYGNDVAMQILQRDNAPRPTQITYPSGSVLALVTWAQRDDPHWFGARIPDTPQTVEFVQFSSDNQSTIYRAWGGKTLAEVHADAGIATQRTAFILNLKPVSMPNLQINGARR
jgi:hypothetical protein